MTVIKMTISKRPARKKRPKAASFRFSTKTVRRLKKLANVNNASQADVLEELIEKAYTNYRSELENEQL